MTTSRTVLIFSHECAPFHRRESTIGAQRPAQFAKHLPKFGWRAIVLCCHRDERGHGIGVDLSKRIDQALSSCTDHESVVIPTPSLAYDGVIDRLWRAASTESTWSFPGKRLLRQSLTALKLRWGDYSQGWQPVARTAADILVKRLRIDLCIGEHSPDAGMHLARWFSSKYGIPWIADFRDPIYRPLRPLLRRIYAPSARSILSSASLIINVTPYWSELDHREFGRPVATVPNGFDQDEFPASRPSSGLPLTISFTGNMLPEMQPEVFLDALMLLKARLGTAAIQNSVRFVYRGLAHSRVGRLAQSRNLAGIVDSADFIDRSKALALQAASDALLLLTVPKARVSNPYLAKGYYPGKALEYLGARRPILCVPGDGGQLDDLLTRTRTGVILPTAEAVADWIEGAILSKRTGKPLDYDADEPQRQSFSRKEQSRQLALLMDGVLGRDRSRSVSLDSSV